jgi:hypothetical protein
MSDWQQRFTTDPAPALRAAEESCRLVAARLIAA